MKVHKLSNPLKKYGNKPLCSPYLVGRSKYEWFVKNFMRWTEDIDKVTCLRCRKIMEKKG